MEMMDWGIAPGRGQQRQSSCPTVVAPAVGEPTLHHPPPPNWGHGASCYVAAAPFDFLTPDSGGFSTATTLHHHYDQTVSPFSHPEAAGVGLPRDGYFSPSHHPPPMPGGHVTWAQAATGISERSLFPFQQQLHSPRDDGSSVTPAPVSAAVGAQFSPRSSGSAASPHSPTFTAGHCSAVSWTSSPPPLPEDHSAGATAASAAAAAATSAMAKPVLKINTTKPAGTPKGAGNKRGLPVVATKPPVTRPSRLSNSNTNSHAKTNTPAKTSNKRLLVEEDDEDDDDDCDNPSATSALTPNNFPTLEEYKTHVRLWHNRIGRKYRNKLNEQFESLLAVLQLEEAHRAASTGRKNNDSSSLQGVVIQGSKKHTTTARGRAVNKAKLLDMARQRIEEMMEERSSWMEEREELHSRLQHSIGTWRQQQ